MKNNSFREIASALKSANTIALYPHINADGDAAGSSIALCLALRKLGKEAYIVAEEELQYNLQFMDPNLWSQDLEPGEKADIAVCVDCGEISRLGNRGKTFESAPFNICIDHHKTSTSFCNLNYIDPGSASTSQLMYYLIKEMEVTIDKEIATCIYAAISTDTGSFKYSNTTEETYLIAADLYKCGISPADIAISLYESDKLSKLKLETLAFETLETLVDGKVAMAYVNEESYAKAGSSSNETDGIVPRLRSIQGVEVAIFLKEIDKNTVKVSMRSKSYVDVARIAQTFSGGGHQRAAGMTLKMPLDQAITKVKELITKEMEKEYDR